MLTIGQMRVSCPLPCGEMKKRKTSVCLFGAPDPAETEQLYQEQMLLDRLNFLAKWQFDVATGSPVATPGGLCWLADAGEKAEEGTRTGDGVRSGRVEKKATSHTKQTKLTDFWLKKGCSLSARTSSEHKIQAAKKLCD